MNYGLLLFSFLLCGIGLTLVFVYFEPLGFVFDGLGFMLFLYVVATRKRDETYDASPSFSSEKEYLKTTHGENYRCGCCRFFGHPMCERNEKFLNAEPCEKYVFNVHIENT